MTGARDKAVLELGLWLKDGGARSLSWAVEHVELTGDGEQLRKATEALIDRVLALPRRDA
jgi:hypothetical protein